MRKEGRPRKVLQMQNKLTAVLLVAALSLSAASADAQAQKRKGFLARLFASAQHQNAESHEDEQSEARAELKLAVQEAVDNRPSGRLWCVPFARAITGLELRGNARTWWAQAEGKYDRGDDPQIGAVLNFSGSRSMPMGHVAVVSAVLSDREILVDHANWARNQISLDNRVVDVSPNNDWSQVRVDNGSGTLGRVNPVFGFIYTDAVPRG